MTAFTRGRGARGAPRAGAARSTRVLTTKKGPSRRIFVRDFNVFRFPFLKARGGILLILKFQKFFRGILLFPEICLKFGSVFVVFQRFCLKNTQKFSASYISPKSIKMFASRDFLIFQYSGNVRSGFSRTGGFSLLIAWQ